MLPVGLNAASGIEDAIPNVAVDHLDYAYIEKCTNLGEVKDILQVLQSGKEGKWPELEKFCEERLIELMPAKERKLFIAQRTEPSAEEKRNAAEELTAFLKNIKTSDANLRSKKKNHEEDSRVETDTRIFEAQVECESEKKKINITHRSPAQVAQDEAKRNQERISGYDFRAWDKFDVDNELERLDKEEQRVAEERRKKVDERQAEIDARKAQAEQAKRSAGLNLDKIESLSEEQREFFADREKEKGNESFKAGEYEDALRFYTRCISILPPSSTDPRPFANRAMAYIKLERWERAEQDCDKALELDATFAKAYARRGMARHRRGKYAGAIDDFEEALHRDPSNVKLNGLLAESRKMYNQVGGIGAEKPGESFKKLMILEDSDEEEEGEAEPPAEQAKEIEQEARGEFLQAAGNQEPQENGTTQQVDSWVELKRCGAELFKAGDLAQALAKFSAAVEVLKAAQTSEETKEHLCNCLGNVAVCHKELGQWDSVVEACSSVLKLSHENAKALFRRGVALENLGKYELALNDMCDVLRLDPERTEAGERISTLMGYINNPETAPKVEQGPLPEQNTVKEPETMPRESVDQLKQQGNDLFKAGDIQGALGKYEQCLNIEPDNVLALSNKAMALLKLERAAECVTACHAGLLLAKDGPTRTKLLYRRASAFQSLGQVNAAVDDLMAVVKAEPQNKRAVEELSVLKESMLRNQRLEESERLHRERRASLEKQQVLAEKALAKAAQKAKSFTAPRTGTEFAQCWRSLGTTDRIDYLASFDHDLLTKIFKVELPEEILMDIVNALSVGVERSLAASVLTALAGVGRFATLLKFLDKKDQQKIKGLLATLESPHLEALYVFN